MDIEHFYGSGTHDVSIWQQSSSNSSFFRKMQEQIISRQTKNDFMVKGTKVATLHY